MIWASLYKGTLALLPVFLCHIILQCPFSLAWPAGNPADLVGKVNYRWCFCVRGCSIYHFDGILGLPVTENQVMVPGDLEGGGFCFHASSSLPCAVEMWDLANLVDENWCLVGVWICNFHIMNKNEQLSVNFYLYSLPIFLSCYLFLKGLFFTVGY